MAVHIERALAQTNGRVEGPFGAARLLGINPNTLRGRMRRLGVDWKRYRGG
jgi:transcriptional regulator with GAF, ATPase, and Fis domain